MNHGVRRDDYETTIPAGEPVFLLRAQDLAAPWTVEMWAMRAVMEGAAPNIVKAALRQKDLMVAWQKLHGASIPDLPVE